MKRIITHLQFCWQYPPDEGFGYQVPLCGQTNPIDCTYERDKVTCTKCWSIMMADQKRKKQAVLERKPLTKKAAA